MPWSYDVTVPNGALFSERMFLTPDSVTFGKRSIALPTVTEVRTETVRHYTNMIPTSVTYKVRLTGTQGDITMRWGYGTIQSQDKKQLAEHAYRQLMDLLDHTVGVRVAQHVAATLPEFGDCTFAPEGVTVRGLFGSRLIPWHQVRGGRLYQGATQVVYVDDSGREDYAGGMSLWSPNAYFLHEVLLAVRNRFLGQAPPAPQVPQGQTPQGQAPQQGWGQQMPPAPQGWGQPVPPEAQAWGQPTPPPPPGWGAPPQQQPQPWGNGQAGWQQGPPA